MSASKAAKSARSARGPRWPSDASASGSDIPARTAEILGCEGLRELAPVTLKGIEQELCPREVVWHEE